ncbi:MAG: CRTAC1 family protein [Anaerolineae bacterium]|nr:CRTAC1 family protein [Anaerolineae bacterium]
MIRRVFLLILLLPTPVAAASHFPDIPPCAGHFIAHLLPHTTQARGEVVRFYESNGSGLGINDLNNDGLLDIVLGNLDRANTVLWNQGGLTFRAEQPPGMIGRTRAVALVDVDADGWRDIVLTTQLGAPSWWRQTGGSDGTREFHLTALPGVNVPAQTLAFFDVDADGDLDLATASYDAELSRLMRDSFLFGGGAGVVYYENHGGEYLPTRLAEESQALAIWLSDLDADGAVELIIGNDFRFPDQAWRFRDGAWTPAVPFAATAYSTMSFDAGDLNNDGALEFFAADMQPTQDDPATRRAWEFVFDDLERNPLPPGDLQIVENLLQVQEGGIFVNRARDFGIPATGWTWSSKFGDLDQDGFLDLYAVNGMIAVELFGHLPEDALVEQNLAFRGEGGVRFVPAPEWNLGGTASGRGMSMGDLDNDGDLDIVVNNLNAPAVLYENALCGGDSLQVELRHPGSGNPDGIGAILTLHTSSGVYMRTARALSGYLSGDPARVHFGFPRGSVLERLDIVWADGFRSSVVRFDDTPVLTVSRS